MDLKEEASFGGEPGEHWYYISKGRAIKDLLGSGVGDLRARRLLDVGAGSGVFAQMLVDDGLAETAVCVDPNYTEGWLAARGVGPVSFARSVEAVDADLVTMIDVIEHVDDDAGLIRDYAAKAAPGTRFVISVPAFQFLWSSHDEFLEHRRRYTEESLRAAVEAGGLAPIECRYFFGLLFPAVAAMRLAERALKGDREAQKSAMAPAPAWMNRALVAVHDIERKTVFPRNRLAGVTVFCLAEKPANDPDH